MKWKKLIHDSETISYVKEVGEYRIILEARHYDDGWEIVKKYLGAGINFAETYTAQSFEEVRRVLKHLRQEKDLSRSEIKDISRFKKKSPKVHVKRGWKEQNVEKWHFSISDNYANYVIIRYGKELCIDVVMEEQLKYIEDKILARLYEVLGVHNEPFSIQQNVYYFSKKTMSYVEADDAELDVEFLFE